MAIESRGPFNRQVRQVDSNEKRSNDGRHFHGVFEPKITLGFAYARGLPLSDKRPKMSVTYFKEQRRIYQQYCDTTRSGSLPSVSRAQWQ